MSPAWHWNHNNIFSTTYLVFSLGPESHDSEDDYPSYFKARKGACM